MITVYDFFSGCGGASQGFRQAGCTIKLGLDNDPFAANTYRNNFPEANFIEKDIRGVDVADIQQFIDNNSIKLFCGCAPCQPFSKQNKNKNSNDSRINLLQEFAKFVKCYKPEFIFVENVPGIQNISIYDSPLEEFCNMLEKYGYSYNISVTTAADYGVPQIRKRLILIASNLGEPIFPAPTHGPRTSQPYSIISEWIKDLPHLEAGGIDPIDPDHCATQLSQINLERIKSTPEGGDRRNWPKHLTLGCHNGHKGHTDVYGRLSYNKICATLTTRCVSYSNGRYGHPVDNRAISVREAACIQTFPRNFAFSGTITAKARQIGNAVPPLLAYQFGKMFLSYIED